jgi:transketolase
MVPINSANAKVWSKLGSRGTFGVAILEYAPEIENLMVLTADLSTTSGLDRFKKTYPEKFLNVGISEQNMIGIAAGMANEGRTVFVTTFSNFAAMRSYEQIRLDLGYMESNVKVVGLAGGMAMGMFGNTHYGIEDMALMRAVPGLTVVSPADGIEIVKAVVASAKHQGPVYIRLTGAMNNPIVYSEDYEFVIGKGITLKRGKDITIIATGTMVYESLVAAKLLEESSIFVTVVNMHTIKPLDTNLLEQIISSSKLIVTVEEHGIIGGLGGAVAEFKATKDNSPRQVFIGLPDKFGKAGEYKYLLQKYGLTGKKIAQRIESEL